MNNGLDISAVSVCGIFDCSSCQYAKGRQCPGCRLGNEMLRTEGKPLCLIYECVMRECVASCRQCTRLPCPFFADSQRICPVRAQFENRRWWESKLTRHFTERRETVNVEREEDKQRIPPATVTRVRWYLMALKDMEGRGIETVSSQEIAQRVGTKAHLVRHDLAFFGEFGAAGVGYEVAALKEKILDIFNFRQMKKVAWIGARRLLDDLGLFFQFESNHCFIVAVLDQDPALFGTQVGNLQIMDLSHLVQVVNNLDVNAAVIALQGCDAQAIQAIADALVGAGVNALLNLSGVHLVVPRGVKVRTVDLSQDLLTLSYYCSGSAEEEAS